MDFDKLLDTQINRLLTKEQSYPPYRCAINIYDINDKLVFTKYMGLGLYHTAFEILGKEVAFGGHPYIGTGVYFNDPFRVPAPAKFYKQINLGEIYKPLKEICHIIKELSKRYIGRQYQLTTNNCNDFTKDLVIALTGEDLLPESINRISKLAVKLGYTGPPGLDAVSQLTNAGFKAGHEQSEPITPLNDPNDPNPYFIVQKAEKSSIQPPPRPKADDLPPPTFLSDIKTVEKLPTQVIHGPPVFPVI